jgi:citrate synthase
MTETTINQGLEGVVVAETKLSMVDGERGELVIVGYPVAELALNATFEETVGLLWSAAGMPPLSFTGRDVPANVIQILRDHPTLDLLTAVQAVLPLVASSPGEILANIPTIVAASWRLRHGREPIAPDERLGHAANYLYMLSGQVPSPERVRALETYLNTVIDHGLNASTFTARVITSTGSDLVSAIVGAIGALKGPLHGGAPGPALDMVFEIGDASRAEGYLRRKIESGEKLMGFGHRVYKVRDPRADVLAAAAARLLHDDPLYALAKNVELTALRLLEEYKPGRRLQTNVEFYTALLLHGLGLEVPLFTPTFALSRAAGWIAHCFEQRARNRIMRPQSVYVGPVRNLATTSP